MNRQAIATHIVAETKTMRDLQKRYFKSRYDDPANSKRILEQSKIQEKKVDQMIEEYYSEPTLF